MDRCSRLASGLRGSLRPSRLPSATSFSTRRLLAGRRLRNGRLLHGSTLAQPRERRTDRASGISINYVQTPARACGLQSPLDGERPDPVSPRARTEDGLLWRRRSAASRSSRAIGCGHYRGPESPRTPDAASRSTSGLLRGLTDFSKVACPRNPRYPSSSAAWSALRTAIGPEVGPGPRQSNPVRTVEPLDQRIAVLPQLPAVELLCPLVVRTSSSTSMSTVAGEAVAQGEHPVLSAADRGFTMTAGRERAPRGSATTRHVDAPRSSRSQG